MAELLTEMAGLARECRRLGLGQPRLVASDEGWRCEVDVPAPALPSGLRLALHPFTHDATERTDAARAMREQLSTIDHIDLPTEAAGA